MASAIQDPPASLTCSGVSFSPFNHEQTWSKGWLLSRIDGAFPTAPPSTAEEGTFKVRNGAVTRKSAFLDFCGAAGPGRSGKKPLRKKTLSAIDSWAERKNPGPSTSQSSPGRRESGPSHLPPPLLQHTPDSEVGPHGLRRLQIIPAYWSWDSPDRKDGPGRDKARMEPDALEIPEDQMDDPHMETQLALVSGRPAAHLVTPPRVAPESRRHAPIGSRAGLAYPRAADRDPFGAASSISSPSPTLPPKCLPSQKVWTHAAGREERRTTIPAPTDCLEEPCCLLSPRGMSGTHVAFLSSSRAP